MHACALYGASPRIREACPRCSVITSPWISGPGDAFDRAVRPLRQGRQIGSVEVLSRRATTHACAQGLVLGFTNIAEADALSTCRRLDRMIGKSLAG
jgi:hypothetical protein